MKWIIDNEEFTSVEDSANYIADNGITEDEYDDMLDGCYDDINICGYEYSPSDALYKIDPIAYYCGFGDYQSICIEDIQDELEALDDGDEIELYNCSALFIEDDDKEEEEAQQ